MGASHPVDRFSSSHAVDARQRSRQFSQCSLMAANWPWFRVFKLWLGTNSFDSTQLDVCVEIDTLVGALTKMANSSRCDEIRILA